MPTPRRSGQTTHAGLQLRGKDVGILHPDLVNAGVLWLQVLNLELVVLPQTPQTVLGLVVEATGDHLAILGPGEGKGAQGLRGTRLPPAPILLADDQLCSHWPRHQTTWDHEGGAEREWGRGPGCVAEEIQALGISVALGKRSAGIMQKRHPRER